MARDGSHTPLPRLRISSESLHTPRLLIMEARGRGRIPTYCCLAEEETEGRKESFDGLHSDLNRGKENQDQDPQVPVRVPSA